jgi:ferrochelatase
MNKKALLLINIGTPDEPSVSAVRKYLSEFLNDPRVIDLPWLARKLLVNLIIVPFRAPSSTKLYKQLWDDKGSPLLYITKYLEEKLSNRLPDGIDVFTAMRYGNPNLKDVLHQIKDKNYDEIMLFPMFPQYASSTTGSLLEFALKEVSKWYVIPKISYVNQFYTHNAFIKAFQSRIEEADYKNYEHIVFSYHGLPLSQVNKSHPGINEETCTCHKEMPAHGKYCYKATCYDTTRLLLEKLDIKEENYSIGFQSRLTKKWLEPFTDNIIESKAKEGIKKLLIVAPAFVTDCLETFIELEIEYAELFYKNGGEKLKLVHSLNDSDLWVDAIKEITQP